jgi:hypothetical protein
VSGAGNWVYPDIRDEFSRMHERCPLFRGFTLNC